MKYNYDIELAQTIREAIYDAEAGEKGNEFFVLKNDLLIKLKKIKTDDGYAYTHEIYKRGSAVSF
jgi:hypothetical protein